MPDHIITKSTSLLDDKGLVIEPGFSKQPNWVYDRRKFQVPHYRMKEWDYYMINTGEIAIAFTLSDLGYMRMASVTFLDLKKSLDVTKTFLAPPAKDYFMPVTSRAGSSEFTNKDIDLYYETTGKNRHISCYIKNFYNKGCFKADLTFSDFPEESMNILTPWEDRKHFYLNEKVNCMPVEGKVVFNYHIYKFNKKDHCGVLDWGRGLWPYQSRWYWGTASAIVDGVPFGFNLGYGFGDLSAASENCLFYKGKVHKLDRVEFTIPQDPMEQWTITSSDGRFEATFDPVFDRAADIDVKIIHTDQHQYFGFINGKAKLDNGRMYEMKNLPAAFEDIKNKY